MISNWKNKINILFHSGFFHILCGSFMTKFVAFFGSIFVVRILTKHEYGILSYLENIYGYAYVFAGLGLANALLRYIVLGKNSGEKAGYYRYVIIRGTIFNIIFAIILCFLCSIYPHSETYLDYNYLLVILMLILPFQFLIDCNLYTERAMFANQSFAFFSFSISTILILGRYLGGRIGGIQGVIILRVLIYISCGIIFTLYIYKKYFTGQYILSLTKKQRINVNKYSLQYMLTNSLWTIFMLNDTFLLGRLCTDARVIADYKVAYVLPANLSIISSAIGIFICPYFVKHETDKSWIRNNYIKIFLIVSSIMGIICLTVALLAKPLIFFMYGSQYINIIPLMRLLLVVSFIDSGLRYTTANILAAMGQIKYNMIISILGMFIQIISNIHVIPIWGAVGIAYTSIFVYLFMAILLFIIFYNIYIKK